MGLITQTAGKAEILGLDINNDCTEILKKVGYLPSDAAFYKGMRVKDILKYLLPSLVLAIFGIVIAFIKYTKRILPKALRLYYRKALSPNYAHL